MKIIQSRFNDELNLKERKNEELKSELKHRGLKVSGTKAELIERLKSDDDRIAVSNAEHQLLQLKVLEGRLNMKQEYYDVAYKHWTEQRIVMTELIERRILCEEELAGAKLAVQLFRENLSLLGVDERDF
tara:strand:+ start:3354 stop:3743 length:390 start_codon:yes stop_codon:yes gene_type:complete